MDPIRSVWNCRQSIQKSLICPCLLLGSTVEPCSNRRTLCKSQAMEVWHGNSTLKQHKTQVFFLMFAWGPVRHELWGRRWDLNNSKNNFAVLKKMDKNGTIHGNSANSTSVSWGKIKIFWGHKLQPLLASWLLELSTFSPSCRTYHRGSAPQVRSPDFCCPNLEKLNTAENIPSSCWSMI